MRFNFFFELIKTVMEINSLAGYFLELQILFFSGWERERGWEEGGREVEHSVQFVGNFYEPYRASHHIQTPQSWTPCSLFSALYSVC